MDIESCLKSLLLHRNTQSKASNLDQQLQQHCEDIVDIFGGWSNMIHLCLTSTTIQDSVQPESLQRFSTILANINTHTSGVASLTDVDTSKNQLPPQTSINSQSIPTLVDNIDHHHASVASDYNSDTASPVSNNAQADITIFGDIDTHENEPKEAISSRNIRHDRSDITVNTLSEYFRSRVILESNEKNCVLLVLATKLNDDFFTRLYDIVSTRRYYIAVSIIAMVLLAISEVGVRIINVTDYGWVAFFWLCWCLAFSIISIVAVSCLLISNIRVMLIVVQTFDFWFKTYNFACSVFAFIMLQQAENADNNFFHLSGSTFTWISGLLITTVFFLMDALHISIKLKKIALGFCSVYALYTAVSWYFVREDVVFNPFGKYGFKHSQISFKSVLLSSVINIAIFVAKPLFSDAGRYLRRKICASFAHDHNTSIENDNESEISIERCYAMYKRPYIKWVVNSQDTSKCMQGQVELQSISH